MTADKIQSLTKKINNGSDKKNIFIGLIIIAAAASLLVYNAFYGLCIIDESFYLTIPYRIMKGDALFINEWHASQFSSVLQYPFVWLFVKITGSGEGIILYFRLLYVIFHVAMACIIFFRMRSYGIINALLSSLLFELYVPIFVLSLNYYTMSLLPTLIIVFLIFFDNSVSAMRYVVCGILLSCAVLAEPSYSIVYFLYFVIVIVFFAVNKLHSHSIHTLLSLQSLGWVTAGVSVIAVCFFAFVLSHETLSEFLSSVGNVFRSGEYSSATIAMGYRVFVRSIFHYFSWTAVAACIFILAIIVDKNRQKRKWIWALLGMSIALFSTAILVAKMEVDMYIPLLYLPSVVAFLGITAYILSEKKEKRLLLLWLVGLLYIVLIGLTSESMEYVGAAGFVISDIASIPLIAIIYNELSKDDKIKTHKLSQKGSLSTANIWLAAASAVCVCILCTYTFGWLSRDFHAPVMSRELLTQTVAVEQGAYKGIHISQDQKRVYDAVLKDVAYIENQTDGKYTVLASNPTYVFSSDRAPLTFSLWYLRGMCDCYKDYYTYIGEWPEYLYIADEQLFFETAGEKIDVSKELDDFSKLFDYTVIKGEAGYICKINKTLITKNKNMG